MERNYVTVTRACRVDIRVEVASLGCSEYQTGQCVITERRQHTLGHQEFIVAECRRCVSACQQMVSTTTIYAYTFIRGGSMGVTSHPWRGSLFHVNIMRVTCYFDVVLCPFSSQILATPLHQEVTFSYYTDLTTANDR